MKKYISILLISILLINFISPAVVKADDDKTVLTKDGTEPFGYSFSEAYDYVSAHKDIYYSDGVLALKYTPTDTYNWTSNEFSYLHLSDNQLRQLLQTKSSIAFKSIEKLSLLTNVPFCRSIFATMGLLSDKDVVGLVDTITSNYNYIDAVNYNESTNEITFDSSLISVLQSQIKNYYYDYIGAYYIEPTGTKPETAASAIQSYFEYQEDFIDTFGKLTTYDSAILINYFDKHIYAFNDDYDYIYAGSYKNQYIDYNGDIFSTRTDSKHLFFSDSNLNLYNLKFNTLYDYIDDEDAVYRHDNGFSLTTFGGKLYLGSYYAFSNKVSEIKRFDYLYDTQICYYSRTNKPLVIFKSYEALYNYVNGSQTAYLGSQVNQAAQDMTFKLDDINDNMMSGLDALLDKLNDVKGSGVSSAELQDAIDKGLADISGSIDNIEDNVEETNNKLDSILELLAQQNQTLLDILGVTEYIASNTTSDSDEEYTISDLSDCFDSINLGIKYALLYGVTSDEMAAFQEQNILLADTTDAPDTPDASDTPVIPEHIAELNLSEGIFGKWPLSVPFQLYDWLKVLSQPAQCPEMSFNYGFLINRKDDPDYVFTLSFEMFEPMAVVCRSFCRLSMTLALAIGTFKRNKGV